MTLLACYNENSSSFSFQFKKPYKLKALIEISNLDILIGVRVANFKYLFTKKKITKSKQRKMCVPWIKSLKDAVLM